MCEEEEEEEERVMKPARRGRKSGEDVMVYIGKSVHRYLLNSKRKKYNQTAELSDLLSDSLEKEI